MTKIPVRSTFRRKPKTGRARRVKGIHRLLAAAIALALTAWLSAQTNQPAGNSQPFPVHIQVNAAKATGPLKQIWRFFGADEPNYAYMKDGKPLWSFVVSDEAQEFKIPSTKLSHAMKALEADLHIACTGTPVGLLSEKCN